MRKHLAPVDGVPVRWLEHGSGPTVVHGPGTAPFAADLGTTVRRIDGGKHCTPEDRPDVLAFEIAALVAEASFGGDSRPPEPRHG